MEKAIEVNCATGEVIERDLTSKEIEQRQKNEEIFLEQQTLMKAEAEAKANAKLTAQAKLQALGLSGEEIAAITN